MQPDFDYQTLANARARGKRPQFDDNPTVDRLTSMLLATVQELAVTRERLDSMERLLAQKGVIAREEVEGFHPDADAAYERGLAHRDLISRVMRPIQQEVEALAGDDATAEELASDFASDIMTERR